VEEEFSWLNLWRTFLASAPTLVLPVIIIGGIIFGVFTPTEAAGVAVVYSFILAVMYGKASIKSIYNTLVDAAITTAMVMIIIGSSNLFGWVLSNERVPQVFTTAFTGLSSDPTITLILITFLLIFFGTFLHGAPMLVIIIPMLMPLIRSLEINPIYFGLIVTFCIGIGQQTPPVGSALFVTSAIAKVDLIDITRENIIFILSLMFVMYLILFIPQIVLFLPNLLN